MTIGFYNLDGIDHEYYVSGKTAFDPATGKPITRTWAYPVRQAVIGGEPVTRYLSSVEKREEYMADHDHCDRLSRRKVPSID